MDFLIRVSGASRWIGLLLAGGLAVGLAGCREDEQNRALVVEKGVYRGAPDSQLDEEQRRALRQRGERQRY